MTGDAVPARATHAPHRARILGLGLSVGIAIAVTGSFVAGAWVQDHRARDYYFRQGQVDATHDAIFDGYWLYLNCLSDDCKHEKTASDFIVHRGNERLSNGGKWVKLVPHAGLEVAR